MYEISKIALIVTGIALLGSVTIISNIFHCEGSKELCARKWKLNESCNKMAWCDINLEIEGCIKDSKCGEQEVTNLENAFTDLREDSYGYTKRKDK